MCGVQRSLVLGLMVGVIGCVSGVAVAQQAAPANDPFGLSSKPKVEPQRAAGALRVTPPKLPEAGLPSGLAVKTDEPKTSSSSKQDVPGLSSVGISTMGAESISYARIRDALSKPITFEFNDASLSDVVQFLRESYKIPVIIDNRALDDVGLGADTPVTISIKGISLRSALRLMLREMDLTYVVRDEVLKITTPEEAENELDTRLYAVSDLAYDGKPPVLVTGPTSQFEMLFEVIGSVVAPDTWDSVGGAGNMEPYDPWGTVVISQTDEVHDQIEALLATIRRGRSAGVGEGAAVALPVLRDADLKARARFDQALTVDTTLDFHDAPLSAVIDFIADQYRIPIIIDRRALDDVGLGSDTPVTVSLSNISLRSALRLMLKEMDLTYMIADEVLKITTPEEAENELLIRVYPVPDFLDKGPELLRSNRSTANLSELRNLLTTCIAPDTWDDVGGAGNAEPVAPWGLMIVAQTSEVHDQTAGLLTAARRAHALNPSSTPGDAASAVGGKANDPFAAGTMGGLSTMAGPFGARPRGAMVHGAMVHGAMVLKRYALGEEVSPQEVERLIRGTVQPASWGNGGSSAATFPVGSTLLIRQTLEAHARIEELLSTAGLLFARGRMGGGMF